MITIKRCSVHLWLQHNFYTFVQLYSFSPHYSDTVALKYNINRMQTPNTLNRERKSKNKGWMYVWIYTGMRRQPWAQIWLLLWALMRGFPDWHALCISSHQPREEIIFNLSRVIGKLHHPASIINCYWMGRCCANVGENLNSINFHKTTTPIKYQEINLPI